MLNWRLIPFGRCGVSDRLPGEEEIEEMNLAVDGECRFPTVDEEVG